MRNIDTTMSRLCTRLMSTAQSSLDAQQYAIEEMEYLFEQNPDREDIRACIEEIKAKNKANESENWATANHWGEHFDGIGSSDEEENPSEESKEEPSDEEGDGE